MQQNRTQLKINSKRIMGANKGKVYLTSILFVALSFAISLLISNLSGTAQFMQNTTKLYNESYKELQEVIEEYGTSEEASEKAFEIMDKTVKRVYVWPETDNVSILLSAVLSVLLALLGAGYVSHCMLISRGEDTTFRDLFNGFSYTGKLLVILIVRAVLVTVGFVLFIVPGFVLLYTYRLSIYVAFDNPDLGAIACMKKARQLAKGRKSELFRLDLSFAGWWIVSRVLGSLSLPVVDIWFKPYFGITVAQWYNNLIGYVPQEKGTENDNSK